MICPDCGKLISKRFSVHNCQPPANESRGSYSYRLNHEMRQRVGLTLANVMSVLGRNMLQEWHESGMEPSAVVDSIDFDAPEFDQYF